MSKVTLKKVILVAAIAVIALVLSGCQTYQVKMSYQCVAPPVPPNTMCMQWEQIGGVETPSTCFPGSATVSTHNGPKSMAELQIGDEILGLDERTGKQEFTRVRAWLHRDVKASSKMVAMTGIQGTLTASPHHLMANMASGSRNYDFANKLQGSMLSTDDHKTMEVQRIAPTVGHGLYAPLTATSNFYVSGPQLTTSVLASSFAEVRHPERYSYALQRIMDIAEFFNSSIHEVHSESYLHPVARVLMKMFPFIIEQHIEEPEALRPSVPEQSVVV